MTAITITDLSNAKLDVDHIAAIATSLSPTATDRLGNTKKTLAGAIYDIAGINNRGAWAPITFYDSKDISSSGGTWYVCVVPHTSSAAFATDTASKWRVYQGVLSGDLAATSGSSMSGHIPAGAGGIATTVQAALRDVVRTSGYTLFADAVTAAANKHLVINSAVTVGADLTIAATTSVSVVQPGLATVNAGQTLTINGSFEAGAFQVFAGAGSVVFGTNSRAISHRTWFGGTVGAVFNTRRTLLQSPTEVGGPVHAYEDDNILYFTNPTAPNYNAYASFDAQTQITGPGGYDHYVGYQARATYSGSGSIWSRWDQFNSYPNHTGAGSVANLRHFRAENPGGTGTIAFQAAFYCENLTRATENYGLFSRTIQNVVRTEAGNAANLLLQGNGQTGGYGLLFQSSPDSSAVVLQTANKPLKIGTNNTFTAVGTADGRWKMAGPDTNTTDVLTGAQRLEVSGIGGATLKATGGAGNGALLAWNAAATGDSLFIGFYGEASPTARGSIDYNRAGGATRYNTTSDAELKNIIGDAPRDKSLGLLASVRLREYSWKDDAANKSQIGVIAQELYETFKGAVSVGGDYTEDVPAVIERRLVSPAREASFLLDIRERPLAAAVEAVYEDVETAPAHTVTKYRPWGVDKTAFTFHLIAGYQAHQALIEAQQANIDALTDRLSAAGI